jgi:hypothetical protein
MLQSRGLTCAADLDVAQPHEYWPHGLWSN